MKDTIIYINFYNNYREQWVCSTMSVSGNSFHFWTSANLCPWICDQENNQNW
jgi:hypothetical protein